MADLTMADLIYQPISWASHRQELAMAHDASQCDACHAYAAQFPRRSLVVTMSNLALHQHPELVAAREGK